MRRQDETKKSVN